MKAIYTICSISHLYKAKTLADSLSTANATTNLYICICEHLEKELISKIASHFPSAHIIALNDLDTSHLSKINPAYTIFELSCALKPFFAFHLLKAYKHEKLIYLDSDIKVFQPFDDIWNGLDLFDFIITPHLTKPVDFQHTYKEQGILKHGLYNAGFFAIQKTENTLNIISWWMQRMEKLCVVDHNNGLYHDQIWLNLLPLYFPRVKVEYNQGYNVAYWNLTERIISFRENSYKVNDITPLKFFHFSGFDEEKDRVITRHFPDLLQDYAGLVVLFNTYREELSANKKLLQYLIKSDDLPKRHNKFFSLFKRKK